MSGYIGHGFEVLRHSIQSGRVFARLKSLVLRGASHVDTRHLNMVFLLALLSFITVRLVCSGSGWESLPRNLVRRGTTDGWQRRRHGRFILVGLAAAVHELRRMGTG